MPHQHNNRNRVIISVRCADRSLTTRGMIYPVEEFARIPGGWFSMGSDTGQPDEAPAHRIWVNTFELAIDPITRSEYSRFLETTGRETPREWENPSFTAPELPVVGVSWYDAFLYCLWRSSHSTSTKQTIRLPSEAEWERAARGHRESENYPWGRTIPNWVPNNGQGPLSGPWPVKTGPVNDFGVRGIAANIHEWCSDWHSKTFYAESPQRNPVGPHIGKRRASRGGSWRHTYTINRVSARSRLDPSFRYTDYGFRIARDV